MIERFFAVPRVPEVGAEQAGGMGREAAALAAAARCSPPRNALQMQGGAPLERESVGESVAISSKPVSSRRNERQAVFGEN